MDGKEEVIEPVMQPENPLEQAPSQESAVEFVPPAPTPVASEVASDAIIESVPPVNDKPTETPAAESVSDADEESLLGDALPAVTPAAPTTETLAQNLAKIEQKVDSITQPAAQPEQQQPEHRIFISEEEFDDVMDDPKKFNAFLNNFQHKTQVEAIQAAHDFMMPMVTNLARTIALQTVDYHSTVSRFYEANPHLLEHRDYTQKVYQALQAKFPDWDEGKLLGQTAKEATVALKKAGLVKSPVEMKKAPTFAPPTGAVRPNIQPTQTNDLRSEILQIRL